MKYAFVTLMVLLFSAGNAQASDSISAYILQKQMNANRVKEESEQKVQKLRSLPANSPLLVNITPNIRSENVAMLPPSPEDLDAIETAAGGKSNKETTDKAAKISIKK